MQAYLNPVMGLTFLVDFLLLLGTGRLCGQPPKIGRAALAAALGAIQAGACLLPGFAFLGNFLWRLVSLGLMACIAFGMNHGAVRRAGVFVLLSMALGGMAMGMQNRNFPSVLFAAVGVFALCAVGLPGKIGAQRFVPVEITYNDRLVRLTALHDTGNTLRDPVTGRQVLVVDAQTAGMLTGLTVQQLKQPVESVTALPGLRLIPYRAVGQEGGLLLALKFPQVKIGSWQGSTLVAFAPAGLDSNGTYQALMGGAA